MRHVQLGFLCLSLTACGGTAGPGGSSCSSLCTRLRGCFGSAAATCPSICQQAVSAYGTLGAAVASACEACVSGATCAAISAGACNASCPWSPGSSGGGGSSAPLCAEQWSADNTTYEVRCTSSDGSLSCSCYEDGTRVLGFNSIDFCSADGQGRRSRAVSACEWPVCAQSWQRQGGTREVRCRGETGGRVSCRCYQDGAEGDLFDSTDFCSVPRDQQVLRARAGCFWIDITSCSQAWAKDNEPLYYQLWCETSAAGSDCTCSEGLTGGSSFHTGSTTPLCDRDAASQKALARTQCGFPI